MTRILACADLHLDRGASYSDDRLGEQEQVWADIVRLAVERECDAILVAGDVFEYRMPSSRARAAFQRVLNGVTLPVLAIPGNHDVKHPKLPTALDLMAPGLGGRLLTVSRTPELVEVGGIVVATLPWHPTNGIPHDEAAHGLLAVAEELIARARGEHPDVPVVLVGHFALDRAFTPSGHPAAEFNEPVLPVDDLVRLEAHACVFGHVHTPDRWDNVISPGSPMPLDFGEENSKHGVWIVDFFSGEIEFVPIESRPFRTIDLYAADAIFLSEGGSYGHDIAGAIVRVRYVASEQEAQRISDAAIREALYAAGCHRLWQIVPSIERTTRARVEHAGALSPVEAIDAWIEASGRDVPNGVRERAREVLEEVAA